MVSSIKLLELSQSEAVILLQCVREKKARLRVKDGSTRITTVLLTGALETLEAKVVESLGGK